MYVYRKHSMLKQVQALLQKQSLELVVFKDKDIISKKPDRSEVPMD